MTYFEDRHGRVYSTAKLHHLRRKPSPPDGKFRPYPWTAVMNDGDELDVSDGAVRLIRVAASPMLPALPGAELVEFCDDKGSNPPEPFVWRRSVIGWRLDDEHGGLVPIVLDPDFIEMRGEHAIIFPDGRVENGCGDQHETEREWFAEQCRTVGLDRANGEATC